MLLLAAMLGGTSTGCGRVNYPEPRVKSPLDRPGVCGFCSQKIESVSARHLMVVDGTQYTVCSEKCALDLKRRLDWENGR